MVSCNKNQSQTKKIESKEIQDKEELSKYDLAEENQGKHTIKIFWNINLDTIKSKDYIFNASEISEANHSVNGKDIGIRVKTVCHIPDSLSMRLRERH
ncbi:hypothetical protein OA88_07040 [Flavobacterium sp. JRM]|nr:hypothetical protein OA88_07040 [Flavobacterium sp. JRM]